jgi:hypothetical protein
MTTFPVDTTIAYHLTAVNDGSIWIVTAYGKGWYSVECVEHDDPDLATVGDTRKVRAKQILTKVIYRLTADGNSWSAEMATDKTARDGDATDETETARDGDSSGADADDAGDDDADADADDDDADDDDDELTPGKRMSRTLHSYAMGYTTVVNASGDKSRVCGDWLSQLLAPLMPEQVAQLAAEILDMDATLYDHLNPGQVRMNWGNRLRAKVKRDELTRDVVEDTLSSLGFAADDADDAESGAADQAHVDDGERMYG